MPVLPVMSADDEAHGGTPLVCLHAAQDIPQFWLALQKLLRQSLPYDALAVYINFLNFATTWRAARILTTPNARRPMLWFEGRRRVDMTPEFVLSQPQRLKLYRLSDVVPDAGELQRTPFFRNYLAPGGWHHLACFLHWRDKIVHSQIAIRRTREQGDFTAEDLAVLHEIHPHVETVLNRLLTAEEQRTRLRWLEEFNDQLPLALMLLNWELETIFVNKEACQQCAVWNFGPARARVCAARSVFHVPADIVAACTELKAEWLEQRSLRGAAGGRTPSVRVSHRLEPGLEAIIAVPAQHECPGAKPGFIVHLENRSLPAADASFSYAVLGKLTAAERELARCVLQGWDNREIATKLGKSVKTVKGQLTSIYSKLGVRSRSRLLALLR